LSYLSTADVLPARIERRRVNTRRRRDPRYWWNGRPIHGWTIQQLVKLAAPDYIDADVILVLDADTYFVRPLSAGDLIGKSGRPYLIETVDDDVLTADWYMQGMRWLGLPLASTKLRQYTHCPVILTRDTVLGLRARLASAHRGDWITSFLRSGSAEYQLHGVYCRYIDQYRSVEANAQPFGAVWWTPELFASMSPAGWWVFGRSTVG
jgi:hypothetical protein